MRGTFCFHTLLAIMMTINLTNQDKKCIEFGEWLLKLELQYHSYIKTDRKYSKRSTGQNNFYSLDELYKHFISGGKGLPMVNYYK